MSFSISNNGVPNNITFKNAENSTDNKPKSKIDKQELLTAVIFVVAHPIIGSVAAIVFLFKACYHKVSEKYHQKKYSKNSGENTTKSQIAKHHELVELALNNAKEAGLIAIPGFGAYKVIKKYEI